MKTIRVSDEAHSQLISIAAELTIKLKEKQDLNDAVEFVVNEHILNKERESK